MLEVEIPSVFCNCYCSTPCYYKYHISDIEKLWRREGWHGRITWLTTNSLHRSEVHAGNSTHKASFRLRMLTQLPHRSEKGTEMVHGPSVIKSANLYFEGRKYFPFVSILVKVRGKYSF
jgi:hypothetical protein